MLKNSRFIILLLVFFTAIFSWYAIADNLVISTPWEELSENPDVSAVQDIFECKNVTWDETEAIMATCTSDLVWISCSDPPLNKSCTTDVETRSYPCENGTQIAQKTEEVCTPTGHIIDEAIQLNTENYRCSAVDDGKIYVTCDSIYDGNGDGICSPGESCVQFGIVGNTVVRYERNSDVEWKESSDSFYLQKATSEVLS